MIPIKQSYGLSMCFGQTSRKEVTMNIPKHVQFLVILFVSIAAIIGIAMTAF